MALPSSSRILDFMVFRRLEPSFRPCHGGSRLSLLAPLQYHVLSPLAQPRVSNTFFQPRCVVMCSKNLPYVRLLTCCPVDQSHLLLTVFSHQSNDSQCVRHPTTGADIVGLRRRKKDFSTYHVITAPMVPEMIFASLSYACHRAPITRLMPRVHRQIGQLS